MLKGRNRPPSKVPTAGKMLKRTGYAGAVLKSKLLKVTCHYPDHHVWYLYIRFLGSTGLFNLVNCLGWLCDNMSWEEDLIGALFLGGDVVGGTLRFAWRYEGSFESMGFTFFFHRHQLSRGFLIPWFLSLGCFFTGKPMKTKKESWEQWNNLSLDSDYGSIFVPALTSSYREKIHCPI